jgi:hypothetical protein
LVPKTAYTVSGLQYTRLAVKKGFKFFELWDLGLALRLLQLSILSLGFGSGFQGSVFLSFGFGNLDLGERGGFGGLRGIGGDLGGGGG